MPLRVKQLINAESLHKTYFSLKCHRVVLHADKILKILSFVMGCKEMLNQRYKTIKEIILDNFLGDTSIRL